MAARIRKLPATFVLGLCCASALTDVSIAFAQNDFSNVEIEVCLPPLRPYPYKLEQADPLYATAREEHQAHLEGMEDYVNCLDRERAVALAQLHLSYRLFKTNFGDDAVLSYTD